MMKGRLLAMVLITVILCSCSTQVMKRAHVVPIFNNQVLLSARPSFTGPGKSLYDDPNFTRPKIWSYEQLPDGATVVHWISAPTVNERLVFLDAGFHPIVVPPEAVVAIGGPGHKVLTGSPTIIDIGGTNSAFIREGVTLIPYEPKAEAAKRMQATGAPPVSDSRH